MSKHKVAELEGILLDAAVSMADPKCEGCTLERVPVGDGLPEHFVGRADCGACYYIIRGRWTFVAALKRLYPHAMHYAPSRQWEDGGQLIERERITLIAPDERPDQLSDPLIEWTAAKYAVDDSEDESEYEASGVTPLVAAMRCYVASKFGDEVELP